MRTARWIFGVALSLFSLACEGPDGPQGMQGVQGFPNDTPGQDGSPGDPGTDGDPGTNGHNAYLTGPGLQLEIMDVVIAEPKASIVFRITDDAGIPLDLNGLYSEGVVTPRFVLAWLDQTTDAVALGYTAYTVKDQTSPINNVTETQAAADEGGTYTEVDFDQGIYQYDLATQVTLSDATKTHTVGAWAARDFEGKRYVANTVYNFLPSGGAVTVTRDIVQTASCNGCHNPLAVHGGQRREVALCITCHSQQTVDPDTGNTVDMKVMIHKIHRGEELPSVVAGTPYQIIGYQQGVHDYSEVVFPQAIENCATCHTGSQGDFWKDRPGAAACGSCHDTVSFDAVVPAGMTAHAGGPQVDDTKCNVCHPPAGGLEGIETKHLTALTDPAGTKLDFAILGVDNTAPGLTPELIFSVNKDGAAADILATPLSRLVVTVAGPTTDYATYYQYTIQGSGASGTLTAESGHYRYVFPASTAIDAAGTYAFGLEGYVQASSSLPRYSANNVVAYAAVTDPAPVPRREVVDGKACESCHFKVEAHGGARNQVEYCTLCHNPENVNDDRVANLEGASTFVESVDLRVMIHKIHMGENLTQPYTLGGFPLPSKANPVGTPVAFDKVLYPGDQKACWACHKAGTYVPPLAAGLLPSKTQVLDCIEDPLADGDDFCDLRVVASETATPPVAAACTGCHDMPDVVAHAETMTSASGVEACATCHGSGAAYDVDVVHALDP